MQKIARIRIPLAGNFEWRKFNVPKPHVKGLVRSVGDAVDLYRRAFSTVYVTAMCLDRRDERLPDDNLEGRDPGW